MWGKKNYTAEGATGAKRIKEILYSCPAASSTHSAAKRFAALLTAGPPSGHAMPAGDAAPETAAITDATGGPPPEVTDGVGSASGPPPGVMTGDGSAPTAMDVDMAAQGATITRIVEDARTDAMAWAAFVAALFVGMGALSSIMLPNPKGEAGQG